MKPDPNLFRDPRPAPDMVYDPPADAIKIIHADDDILIAEKPAGLLTVPAKFAGHTDCLEARLRVDFPTIRVVHRLDMDTSGVIVLALTDQAQRHLGRQFEQKRAQKTYIALVHGIVDEQTGEIDLPLANDKDNMPKQKICLETGRPAQTAWRALSVHGDRTRLVLKPKTGRSHQLRVHLRACGHAIVGDRFYADSVDDEARLYLHATHLKIRHPATNHFTEFESDCCF